MKHILSLILFLNTSIIYAQKTCGLADVLSRSKNGKEMVCNQPICVYMANQDPSTIRRIVLHRESCSVVSDVFFINEVYYFVAKDKNGKTLNGEIVCKANKFSEFYISYDAYTSITFILKPNQK